METFLAGASSGWVALACIPLAALVGWYLRRRRSIAPLVVRMRPHYIIGYGTLILALLHVWFSMASMRVANALGLRLAVLALIVIAVQAVIGASLQDPGRYRRPIKGWHIALFVAALALSLAHALLDGVLFATSAETDLRSAHRCAAIAAATMLSATAQSTCSATSIPLTVG